LSKELGVHRRTLYKWHDQFAPFEETAEPATGSSPHATLFSKVHQLHRLLVDKDAGGGFSKVLHKVEGSTSAERIVWRVGVYDQIQELMPLQGSLIPSPSAAGPGSLAARFVG
jgi:hypothetical protein